MAVRLLSVTPLDAACTLWRVVFSPASLLTACFQARVYTCLFVLKPCGHGVRPELAVRSDLPKISVSKIRLIL